LGGATGVDPLLQIGAPPTNEAANPDRARHAACVGEPEDVSLRAGE